MCTIQHKLLCNPIPLILAMSSMDIVDMHDFFTTCDEPNSCIFIKRHHLLFMFQCDKILCAVTNFSPNNLQVGT